MEEVVEDQAQETDIAQSPEIEADLTQEEEDKSNDWWRAVSVTA